MTNVIKSFPAPFHFLLFLALPVSLSAQSWNNWRGPTQNGVGPAGDYPVNLTGHIAWKLPLAGRGSSSPVIVGDNLYITSAIDGEDGVHCIGLDGKLRWQVKLGKERPGKHKNGSGSNPSVATDGKRVFAYFKSGTVAGIDGAGKVLWKINLQEQYGKDLLWWDLGTSPVYADGKVIIAVMHETDPYLVALDPDNGNTLWKVERGCKCLEESCHSYTTPIVHQRDGQTTLITWGGDRLTCHAAADGRLLWHCDGFNDYTTNQHKRWRVIAGPAIDSGIAVVPYGRGNYFAAVKLGGSGDVTKTHRLWEKSGIGSDVPTPVAVNGKTWLLGDSGKLSCFDIESGKELWSDQFPKSSGKFYSSPFMVGNKLYAARDNGKMYVAEIRDAGMTILKQFDLGERIAASPAFVDNRIYLRTFENLYCFSK